MESSWAVIWKDTCQRGGVWAEFEGCIWAEGMRKGGKHWKFMRKKEEWIKSDYKASSISARNEPINETSKG